MLNVAAGIIITVLAALVLMACNNENGVSGLSALVQQIERTRVGHDPDQWIEMLGMSGEWEKTGLIFGYYEGDYDECLKAIAGLKRANSAREYRCTPAN